MPMPSLQERPSVLPEIVAWEGRNASEPIPIACLLLSAYTKAVTPIPPAYGRDIPGWRGEASQQNGCRGFGWKRPSLPCLERSKSDGNLRIFVYSPIPCANRVFRFRRALMSLFDKFGRQITDLRISVTDRCNFRCVYCRSRRSGKLSRARRDSLVAGTGAFGAHFRGPGDSQSTADGRRAAGARWPGKLYCVLACVWASTIYP